MITPTMMTHTMNSPRYGASDAAIRLWTRGYRPEPINPFDKDSLRVWRQVG